MTARPGRGTRADIALDGRTALVTGAGRGVGRGIAQVLAEQGAAVIVNDLHRERAESVVEEIVSGGGTAVPVAFDISDLEAVRAGVAEAEAKLGPIGILVNNAGVPEGRYQGVFSESEPADWEPDIRLNIYGALHCIHATVGGMKERGWGRIIQISSGVAARGVPYGRSLYGLGKAAMEGQIRHLSLEVVKDGVTVNALSLGFMVNAAEYADPKVVERVLAGTPMGRGGEPWEAGAAVAWLASDGAAFVTGQVIYFNGGSYQGR